MAKVTCESCGSSFPFERVKGMEKCPVCGEALWENGDSSVEPEKEKHTYYYYKEGGGMLDDTLSSHFTPLYTFEAVDMQDAERQLKEVMPNSPLINNSQPEKVRCPRCRSTEIQLVPKKFSLRTGFATNRFDRMCVNCKKKF